MSKLCLIFIYFTLGVLTSSCSIFFGENQDQFRSEHYDLNFSHPEWKKISNEESDIAFEHKDNHSIIYVNSFCKKHDSTSLSNLVSHLFAGIDQLQMEEKNSATLFEREAIEVKAKGKVDGVEQFFQIFVVNKNRCTYDFILIANSIQTRESASNAFQALLSSVVIK